MTAGNSGVEPCFRIMSNIRTIVVDNRCRTGFDGQGTKHNYRSHYGNQDFYMRRNMSEYGDGIFFQARANNTTVLPSNIMGDHWVYDHLSYYNGPGGAIIANSQRTGGGTTVAASWNGSLTTDDNTAYRAVRSPPCSTTMPSNRWRWNGEGGDSIGVNTECPYEAPPALGSWLTARGTPPGIYYP